MKVIARFGSSVVVACLAFAACGDGRSDGTSPGLEARETLERVDEPLRTLSESMQKAQPAKPSSMADLRTAAAEARDALDGAAVDIQRLAASAPPAERAELEQTGEAIQVTAALAAELEAKRIVPAELASAGKRASAAIAQAGVILPPVSAEALVRALRNGGLDAQSAKRPRAQLRPFDGSGFRVQLPTGPGWSEPSTEQPTPGRLFRTTVSGPEGLFVLVDYTPFESAQFGGTATSVSTAPHPRYGTMTRYLFTGGSLPDCQSVQCVDFIINDATSGRGFGVVAGGRDSTSASALALAVARTVEALH